LSAQVVLRNRGDEAAFIELEHAAPVCLTMAELAMRIAGGDRRTVQKRMAGPLGASDPSRTRFGGRKPRILGLNIMKSLV
jgi:hypothetical protein